MPHYEHCNNAWICKLSEKYSLEQKCACDEKAKEFMFKQKKKEQLQEKKEKEKGMSEQVTFAEMYLIQETPKQEMERKDIRI